MAQRLALLPIILTTLKDGMSSIKCDRGQQERLMNWLVDVHTKAMRLNMSGTLHASTPLSSVHAHFNNFFTDPDLQNFEALNQQASSDVKKFLEDAIRELDIKVQMLDQVYVNAHPQDEHSPVEMVNSDGVDPVLAQLKEGVSVEINLGGEPGHGKLSWIDPALANLILTLDGQENPSIVSVRMFRRMIAHGRVKFIETEPLFERAVQSLLKSADAQVASVR